MNRSLLNSRALTVDLRGVGLTLLMMTLTFIGIGNAQLACNDHIQLSLDENCIFQVYLDHLLEAPPRDTTCLTIEIKDANGNVVPGALFNSSHRDQEFYYTVFDTCNKNSCWGVVNVEDKLPPQFECNPYDTIWCSDPDYVLPRDMVREACGSVTRIIESDELVDLPCDSACSAKRYITYYYVDESGNKSNVCIKEVCYRRGMLSDVDMPADVIYSCDEFIDADPGRTGVPEIDGYAIYPRSPACEINCVYEDQRIDICPESYKILRKWTCYDWCKPTSAENPSIDWQVIKILDQDPPQVYCPTSDRYRDTIGTDVWSCSATHILPEPYVLQPGAKITDSSAIYIISECSETSYSVTHIPAANPGDCTPARGVPTTNNVRYDAILDRWIAYDLPLGCNWFYYSFVDECGNKSQCSFDIYVEDDVPPVPVCDEHTVVTLNEEGLAKVWALTFDDGSVDNCQVDSFDVRRMSPTCDSVNWDVFGPYVLFCCGDLGNTVMVELRVWDAAGNMNTCMVEVTVKDKQAPKMIPPPDITVDCRFDYDADDLSIFGKVVIDESWRKPIILKDDHYAPDFFAGVDGWAWDNCQDIIVTDTAIFDLICGVGYIRRIFTATDPGGLYVTKEQLITFEDKDTFGYDDIKWPVDVVLYGCIGIDTDTSKTLTPSFQNTGCAHPAMTFEDLVFTQVPDACYKIERKWTVVDWCAFDLGYPEWQWSYKQIIKVTDKVAPVFKSCEDELFCDENAYLDSGQCIGRVSITPDVEDACTSFDDLNIRYRIDAFQSGTYGAWVVGKKVEGDYPVGVHNLEWDVADGCGNSTRCEISFEVKDCKAPTPYCRTGIVTVLMEGSGSVTIWASDFNIGSFDNCTDTSDLTYSFSADTTDIYRTYDCDSLNGELSIVKTVRMYVTDECGNQDYCETTIEIQDNNKCVGNLLVRLSGTVTDELDSPIEGAEVRLINASNRAVIKTTTSDDKGYYEFPGVIKNNPYNIQAFRDDDDLNGVSTRDITFIQRELLGKSLLNSAYKRIAADANGNDDMTAGDISEIRKLILGRFAKFPKSDSWRFMPTDYVMGDVMNPWGVPGEIVIPFVDDDKDGLDFTGMKVGDVDNSAELTKLGSNSTRDQEIYEMTYSLRSIGLNKYRLDFYADASRDLTGMQMTIETGAPITLLDVQSGWMEVGEHNVSDHLTKDGQLTFSWSEMDGTEEGERRLMSLVLESQTGESLDIDVTSKTTVAEAYDAYDEVMSLSLKAESTDTNEGQFELMQNVPNPFTGSTSISFNLPKAQNFVMTFYDPSGRTIRKIEGFGASGKNAVEISQSDLSRAGGVVVFYQLDTEEQSATKKLIMLR